MPSLMSNVLRINGFSGRAFLINRLGNRHAWKITIPTIFVCIFIATYLLRQQNTETFPAAGSKRLTIYQLYYSKAAWTVVHNESDDSYFRPMCVVQGMERTNGWDISAPSFLPILKDSTYQKLLCEYGSIFATANQLAKQVSMKNGSALNRFLGFQSWRAKQKDMDLSENIIPRLEDALTNGSVPENSFLYWGRHWVPDIGAQFYNGCTYHHGNSCVTVFQSAFKLIFENTNRSIDYANPTTHPTVDDAEEYFIEMPLVPQGFSYFSYFIMSASNLIEYSHFARSFFVAAESLYGVSQSTSQNCPISPSWYSSELCWCFVMERLVNVWWYHSGKPAFVLNRMTGDMEEVAPLQNRTVSPFFEKNNMERSLKQFQLRLRGRSRHLYYQLQGRE